MNSIVPSLELTDFDAEQRLLRLGGTSLVIFTSIGCASCRWARQTLPGLVLDVARLCWVDGGNNGGLVRRYEVFHLPSLFLVRDGRFFGELHCRLTGPAINTAVLHALQLEPEELP